MRGLAKATICGNLTADPQSKQIGDSTLVTTSIACNDKNMDGSEYTSFFNIEAWGKAGEILAMAGKGDGLLVECKMRQDRFEQEDSGGKVVKRDKTRLKVIELRFLGSRGRDGND